MHLFLDVFKGFYYSDPIKKERADVKMTSRERFKRMYEHREADRVPITDGPWAGTVRRWNREGMPEGVDWREYFGVDIIRGIAADNTLRLEQKVIEETDEYVISTTQWGVTLKYLKNVDSTPEFLDYTVKSSDDWARLKARMAPNRNRVDWERLKQNYPKWAADGNWLQAGFWFGFDATHSWMSGFETVIFAMVEQPEWMEDIFNTYLDTCIASYDMIWDEGYRFDAISWADDMGYKNATFFSKELYRKILKPIQKRAIDWAHNKGVYAHLHSCGNIMAFVPELVEIGLDALNPLEVKAGMDPIRLKKEFGDKLVFHGGINAVLWDDKEKIIGEIDRVVPVMKENGGYVFSSDHSIPNTVSLDNFKAIIAEVKRVGAY